MLYCYINLLIKFNIIKHLTISSRVILTLSLILQCLLYIAYIFTFSKIVRERLRLFALVIKMSNTISHDA